MKKTFTSKVFVFATILTIGVGSQSLFANAANAKFTSSTKTTSKINVKSVEYDYDDTDDSIEIDFSNKIKLKSSAKASVKDSSGKTYKTFIEESDNNEIDLDVANLKAGKKYTVTINGIKNANASKYGTLTINFSIPKASTNLVKDVEFDNEDKEVSFDFRNNVKYNNVKVTITNTKGTKTYKTTVVEKDNDELTVRVNGLTEGKTYKYTITGVTEKASGSSKKLTGTFVALDN
ncbi:hypothetical protein [Anaerosporobacter sp.]